MNFTLDNLLSYLSPLVLAALGWAWRLDNRIAAFEARHARELGDLRVDEAKAAHELETELRAAMVPMPEFRKLEERIEKRLDRNEAKLDEAIALLQRLTTARNS
ncbi:MAG: hypothetical protein HQL39_20430 [Alphaproteobacteria bacterium]|nr:hypothetical protein [Alphaproteobacteria bacterium]